MHWTGGLRKLVYSIFFLLAVGASQEALGQCSVLPPIISQGSNKVPAGFCSPVSADLIYQITFFSPLPAGHTYQLRYNWGDGSANTNIAIAVGTTVINNTTNHVFPVASDCEYQVIMRLVVDGNVCFTTSQTQLITSWRTDAFNGGNVRLISPVTGTNIHDVCIGVNTSVVFSDLSVFNCNSAYPANYPPAAPITTPNEQMRWQQIIYNTPNAPARIPNVTVNQPPPVAVTGAGGADLIINYLDPRVSATQNAFGVFQMTPLTVINDPRRRPTLTIQAPGGFGAGFPQVGDEFEITIRYWSFCNPYANDFDLTPVGGNNINGDNPPVEATAYVRIIGAPAAPAVNNPTVCETTGTGSFNITATGVGGGTLNYTWYKEAALTTVLQGPNTDNTFNPVTEGPAIHRINPAVGASTVFTRYVTVTQGSNNCTSPAATITITIDDTNTPGTIAHPLGATPITICSADDPVAFTSTGAGTGGGPGGAIAYQWQNSTASGGPYADLVGATAATFDPSPANIAAGRFFRRRLRSGQCADVFSNIMEFRVDTPVTGGSVTGNQTICSAPGDPANLANSGLPTGGAFSGVFTYQWEESTVSAAGPFNTIVGATATSYDPPAGVVVTTFYRRRVTSGSCVADGPDAGTDPDNVGYSNVLTVTVNQIVVPGAIGNPQVLCAGQNPAILTEVTPPSGGDGVTYAFQWQQSATGGGVGFAAAAGVNNTATYDPPVLAATTFYRRRVTSGVCPATFSNEIQVTINPLPTAGNPTGGGAVCSGNPAPDIVWTLTGTAPFNVTYTMTPGGPVTVMAHPSTTFTISNPSPGVNTTYQITTLVDANGCSATSMGTAASVTIGGTAPSFDSGPTLDISQTCVSGTGFPQDPSLIFSLDDAGSANSVPPHFTLNYRVDGSAIRTKIFATNATGGPTAPVTFTDAELNNVAPSPHVISLVSVVSPSGCQTLLPPINLNFTVNPLPTITTQPTNQTVCQGLMATYNVVANVVGGVTYQWQESVNAGAFANVANGTFGGRVYAGATTATLTIDNVSTVNAYTYRVIVTANTGSCPITSNTVSLTVNPLPTPTDQTPTVCSDAGGGTTATVNLTTLQVAIDGNVGRSFAWFTGYNPATKVFSGAIATPTSFLVTNAVPVFCQVTIVATGCVAPATVTYTVNPKATITVNPTNATICVGDPVTFTVTAAGPGLGLRWQENGVNINDGTFAGVTYAGSTTATLNITGTTIALNGRTYRAVTTTTGACVLNSTAATLTVNPLPTVNNQTPSVCSAVPGGNQQVVNLTSLNTAINAGAGATVTITWFQDYDVPTKTFSNPIAPGAAFGQDQQYQVTNGEDLFARVVTNATGCINVASAVYTVKPMPNNNQIKDGTGTTISTVPTSPATYNICASGSSILFQTDDTINPGSSFAWTVPPVSYPGEFITVTASANILVMRFPNPTEAPAGSLYNGGIPISVTETLNGCAGNPVTMMVHVLAAPAPSVISGDALVCENATANYSVPFTAGSTYSWTLPTGATITSLPVTANAITVQMGTISGNVTVVESNGTCLSAPAAPFAVTVAPRPVISTTVNPICSGANVNTGVSLSATIPGSTFNWVVLSITGTLTGVNVSDNATGVLNINQTPINTSGVAAGISYQVTPVGPGPSFCTGTPAIISVTVNPEPVLSLLPKTICAGAAAAYEIKLTPANLPAGTRFSWAAPTMSDFSVQGSPSAGLVPMGAAGTIHINDSFINNSAAAITATYTITAQSGAGCNSSQPVAARQVVITINPRPVGANLTHPAQCSNTTFNLSADNITNGLGAGMGTTFAWVRDPLPVGLTQVTAGTGTGNISERLRNLTAGQLTATYVVTPTSSLGCVGATYVISVPVNPEPVGADVTRAAQCSNVAFSVSSDNITNGLGGTSTYAWVRNALPAGLSQVVAGTGTGAIAETLQNLTSAQLTATYTVTPTSASGCVGATYLVSVPVNPQPVGANATKAAQCSGVAFSFNPQLDITNSVNSTFAWTAVYDGGSGNLTGGAGAGTGLIAETLVNLTAIQRSAVYTVTPTSVTGTCLGATFIITVPINPQPVGASTTKASQCSGVAFSFNPQADISNGVTSTFVWTASYDGGSGQLTGGAGSGTGLIAETLVNVSAISRSAVYTITPTATTGSCLGAQFTITIPVNPQPVGANSTKANQCSDVAFSFDPQIDITNGVASTFTWTAVYDGGSGQLTGGAGSGTGLVAEALNNISGTTRNAVYTVTPRSAAGLCFGSTFVITVPVRPEPVGSSATKAAQCSNVAFSFNPQADIINSVTSTFAWTAVYDGGSGNLTGGAGSGTGLIAETLVNVTSGQLSAVYTVTPSASTGGCIGTPFTITVPVNPRPVGANSTKANQCSGVAFTFNPQADITNGVASTFSWTAVYDLASGLLTGGAGSGTGSINETLVNLTAIARSAVYTITPTSTAGSCVGPTYTITVPVNPQPVGANNTKATQCSDVAFSFDPQGDISNGVASTFTWTAVYDGGSGQLTGGAGSGTGLIAETLNNVSGLTRNAVYTVTPRSTGGLCFGSTFVVTIPVRSEPVGANATKAAQCSGIAFSFNPQTDITNSVTSTFAWTAVYDGGSGNLTGGAGSGTGMVAETLVNMTGGQLNAVYTITPSSSTGSCVGTSFNITVPVNPQPVGVNSTKANQCSGVVFSFNPQADISNGVASSFAWTAVYDGGSGQLTGGLNNGTGNITETLVNLTSSARNAVYTVTPTATTGSCVGASFTITVPVNPQPVGANSTKAAQCSNVAFSFDPQGDITNGVASSFTWTAIYDAGSGQLTGGAGSGIGLIAETLINVSGSTRNAVYTVTPRSTAGLCFGATYVITVPIRSEPVGMPVTKASQCSGVAFSFNPQTDIVNGVTSTFAWTAVYDAGSGNLTGGAGSGTGLLAETLTNITGGTLNAVYTVTPTSTAGTCLGASFNITIPITSQPVGANAMKAAQCSNVAFSFNPQTDITNGVTSTFTWTAVYDLGSGQLTGGAGSGTGNVAETLVNLSAIQRSAVYTITPTSSVGTCVGPSFTITVPVNPQPVGANITRAAQCSNVAFSVSPDNITNGLGATSTYAWSRNALPAGLTQVVGGTGTGMIAETLQNLTGAQLSATYVVTPTSASGCVGATYVITIPVNPEPVGANITLAAQCSNVAFNLSANNITNGLGGTSTYAWVRNPLPPGLTQIAGGVSGATIAETLENLTGGQLSASYVVTPTSGAGCVGQTYVVTIPVNPQPVGANVTRAAQCSGVAFSLSADNITNGLGATSTYTWVRNPLPPGLTQVLGGTGTGLIAETLQNLTSGQLSAIYTVTPTSGSGCVGATYQVTVPVNPAPVGAPTTTVQRCSGDVIAFDLNTLITNTVPSVFRYTVVADFPLDLSPSVFPGTFDRTVASNALISETFSNYSNHDVTLTYTVTPISDPEGCTGANFTFKVVYHPEPVGANLVEPNCNTTLNHNIQTQISNGVTAEFTYTVSSSDELAVPTPPALDRTIASDAFITDAYTNLSGVAVTITYTIQAFNKTFPTCASAATFTYQVTISPKPVGISDTKPDVCSDVAFSVDPQNNISPVVASTFAWTATYDGSPIAPGTGVINATFTNTSNAVKNAIYNITPTAVGTGCVGNPFTITIPIQPEPVIDPALATPFVICSTNPLSTNPTNVNITTNGSSIAAASYIITLKSQDAALVGTPTTGTFPAIAGATAAIANDTYTNTTAAQLTVVYTVVPVSSLGCLGNAFDITVQVNPEPVLSNPGFPAVCSTNTSGASIINVVLGTNGTSVAAASYELIQVQYSNGGPFGMALPPGFTAAAGNTVVTATGDINLIKNDKYTNTSAVAVTVRYTIQGTSAAGCSGGLLDYDIVINPEPTLDPLLNPTPVCSGVASGVTLGVAAGSVAATTYNINSILFPGLTAGPSNSGIGNNKLANAIFNDVYVNTTNGVLTATYKISPVSAAGCVGPEGTVTLTINPSPDLANTLNRTVCTNGASGITFTTTPASVAAMNYNVINVTPQAGLVPAGTNAAFPANAVGVAYVSLDQFVNPTNAPLTVTYRVEPRSAAGCLGPQEDIILTVEPTITAAPINLKPTVCSGSGNGTDLTDIEFISPTNPSAGVITFNYTAVSSIGTQITGFVPALSGLAEGYKITDNLVNASDAPATVTYTITPVAAGAANGAGCSGAPAIVVVTVEPKPKLIVTSIKTVCEGVATAISLTSTTTPSVGTIEFLLVSATPTGGVTGASANGTVFANGATLNDVLSNPTTTAQTVTYQFRPRFNGGAGCVGDDVYSVVTVNPRPTVVPSPQAQICSGDIVDILLTTDVVNTVSTWTVTAPGTITGSSGGAGDRIFQILFNSGNIIETVTYNITPQANTCAGTMVPVNVTVNPKAIVLGTPATTTVCHGATLNVPLSSNVAAGVSYTWDVVSSGSMLGISPTGSGNVINQLMTNTTGAQVTLTYTIHPMGPGPGAGCPGTDKIMIVNVSPEITAAWLNSPSPEFLCNGQTAFLVLQMNGRAPFNYTYNDGVNPPITQNNRPPVVVLQHPMSATRTFTLTSVTDGLGCTTPFNVQHTVNVGDTDPNYTIISPVATCSPNEVSFQYNQVAGTIYTWRFGDTPDSVYLATTTVPNKVIKHTYENLSPSSTLNYPVTLQTELPAPFPGCFKSNPAQTVTIYPNVITNVVPNKTEICSGETISFMNSSVGTSGQTWAFRVQGQVPETAMGSTFNMNFAFTNNTAANPITYEVIFRATNGTCPAADVIIPIQVYRFSVANFTVDTPAPIEYTNGEAFVDVTNTSSILDPANFTYDWVFGPSADPPDASTVAPATIRYTLPGPKDIQLTVTNTARTQCKTTFTVPIDVVLPPLDAFFDASPVESCFPSKITVSNDPTKTKITGDIIKWSVVDQNNRTVATSSGATPEFVLPAPGEYRISVETSSSLTGQSASFTHPSTFVSYDKPFASFDARPDVVFVPDTEMQIFNFSDDPSKVVFVWDFGDGDVLTAPAAPSNDIPVPSGTHNDRTKGTYEEPIHIYKVEGIYDITLITKFDHGAGVVCADTLTSQVQARQGGVTKVPNAFTPSTKGPNSGSGTGGNGTFNDVFLPIVKGADEFNLQIYDRWGNLIFESNDKNTGWDGYNANGQLLPAGVYVYKLTVRLSDGQRSTQVGDITMIR